MYVLLLYGSEQKVSLARSQLASTVAARGSSVTRQDFFKEVHMLSAYNDGKEQRYGRAGHDRSCKHVGSFIPAWMIVTRGSGFVL